MSSKKPSSHKPSSSSSSSSRKKVSSSSKSKPAPIPISIPRGRGGRHGGNSSSSGGGSHNHVPLSQSFTRDDITRSIGRPESFYPKVGDDESVNTINGDFKFIPPHIIGQREREKEIARSYDKHHRRRFNHHIY